MDSFDIERALSLVTEDIEWIREAGTIRGREDVGRVLAARSRQRCTRHLVANLDVRQFDLQSGQARCDVLVYQGIGKTDTHPLLIKGPDLLLSNNDELVLQGERWKISKKTPTTIFKFAP